jgi:hypothetical protein
MTQVQRAVEQMVQGKRSGPDKAQVNVRLGPRSVQLLDKLSKRLDVPKKTLAERLIYAALHDSCKELGIETKYPAFTPEQFTDFLLRGYVEVEL